MDRALAIFHLGVGMMPPSAIISGPNYAYVFPYLFKDTKGSQYVFIFHSLSRDTGSPKFASTFHNL